MRRLYVSAAHKSSGKTALTIGLCAALAKRGLVVQPFKKGPDYIDPMWLSAAAGRTCWNLDFHTQSHAAILATVAMQTADADIALIEGNKGLHDGVALEGADSSAALAKLVGAAVVLVIDTSGMTRGIAPLLTGYRLFDPSVQYGGVILNKVAGPRHERKLVAAIERYVGLSVLGAVYSSQDLNIAERHLGLVPSHEHNEAQTVITRIRAAVERQVDLEGILTAATAESLPITAYEKYKPPVIVCPRVRIAVACDAAFRFYYPDDLAALTAAGADVVSFNTLQDSGLPSNIDGLFIGGGFPEIHMVALEANTTLRIAIRTALEAGLPTYAECGGLMYLSRCITWQGRTCDMVGAIAADTVMHERPHGRGYMHLVETAAMPWPDRQPACVHAAHEFHHSSLENLEAGIQFAYHVVRGEGIIGHYDGIVTRNILATYAHRRSVGELPWGWRFVAFVESCRACTAQNSVTL
ncbi:Cobyrinic acid A,C-diamide synthase [invertebrate metagenome]|uniref:Cobyrinic acid A,C-diamide synthase n=1 Tax=invertebrate metagenome TaxID=1711999 RepID=A0A484HBG0_9ZZZZ